MLPLNLLMSLAVGIRRKAMKPLQFKNGGPYVKVGEIACVSAWDIMHNESKYPQPDTFDGLRFVPAAHKTVEGAPNNVLRGTTFVDGSKDFPIWGLGSKIW